MAPSGRPETKQWTGECPCKVFFKNKVPMQRAICG